MARTWADADLVAWDERADLGEILEAVAGPRRGALASVGASPPGTMDDLDDACRSARAMDDEAVRLARGLELADPPASSTSLEEADLFEAYGVGRGMHLFARACLAAMNDGRLAPHPWRVHVVLRLLRQGAVDALDAVTAALDRRTPSRALSARGRPRP